MDEKTNPVFESACGEFGKLLCEYESALKTGKSRLVDTFDRVKAAWERVLVCAPKDGPKANPSPEMYLVLAFSHAVGAGDADEAERLYRLMSEKERRKLDSLESSQPGKYIIWARPA